MNMLRNIRWTIPNMLSLGRLLSAPVMLLFVALSYETAFVILFILMQLSDILDGYIARKYKLESPEGALLDSYADLGSYIVAFAGICRFHIELFTDYGWWLIAFAALYVINMIIAKIKFGKLVAGLHLYSSKITGYLQGSFLVVLFAWQLSVPFFYIMIIFGILTEFECISINLAAKRPVVNAKGWYWVIKEKRLQ